MSLKLQESLLYHMQKKAENKLASFQATLNVDPHEGSSQDSPRLSDDQHPCRSDQPNSSNSWFLNATASGDKGQSVPDNPLQNHTIEEEEDQIRNLKEPQKIKQLHMSLENIKKQIQSMQQTSDFKNMTESQSPDDSELNGRFAIVELERKKLKNKLLELQEKKKLNAKLLQELTFLRDTDSFLNHTVDSKEIADVLNVTSDPGRSFQHPQFKEKKRAETNLVHANRQKLHKLKTSLQHLEGMMEGTDSEENIQNDTLISDSAGASSTSGIDLRHIRSASMKRDNVRKEINSGFPARRHYEAEGRANEDADLPSTSQNQPPAIKQHSLETQEKLRKLQAAQKHLLTVNDFIASLEEADKRGNPIPFEHLHLLSSLESQINYESENELSSCDSAENVDYNSTILTKRTQENVTADVKEACAEGVKSPMLSSETEPLDDVMNSIVEFGKLGKPMPPEHLLALVGMLKDEIKDSDTESESEYETTLRDIHSLIVNSSELTVPKTEVVSPILPQTDESERVDVSPAVPYNVELTSVKKDYTMLQNLFNRLALLNEERDERNLTSNKKKVFPIRQSQSNEFIQMAVEGRSDDIVRSSGEGGCIPNRNPDSGASVSGDHVQSLPSMQFCHQDNLLLTRQNIATMESQNQSCSRNIHNRSCGTKQDNINNLSGKMGKLSIQNAVKGLFSQATDRTKDSLDSMSLNSSELNHSHSGEMEHKTILDILKRSRKKQKLYDRNQDNQIRSNSSIDSEILEGSNSALAADTTAAATWGGSSIQENFEEENEPSGSLGMQHGVDGNCAIRRNAYPPPPKSKKTKMVALQRATSGSSNELPSASHSSDTIKDNQQQISSNFIQQLKRQVDQLNALCQDELREVQQMSMNFHPNTSQNLLNTSHPLQAVPEIIHPYNQQLLLCLSQCYHTLYMQQLEIQHLHRCLRHSIDAEVLHQASNLNSQCSGDDIGFRPWYMPTYSNPLMPSNIYSNEQISPRSSANYFPLPLKPYPPHNVPVAGTRPVRAVIHPANQENTTSRETLNNQVPPRNRANNFWDNFRSYSRQNMLSTSNNSKRNENIGLPVAPQIRQVHPMVSNEGTNQEPDKRYIYPPALSTDFNRSMVNPDGPWSNSCLQDLISSRSKKPNASTSTTAQCRYSALHKRETSINLNSCDSRNIRAEQCKSTEPSPVPLLSNPTSANSIPLYPIQGESKIGNFSSNCPPSSVASTSDVPSFPQGEYDCHSDFPLGLYREAKALKSEVKRQQALNMIRDLAMSERGDIELSTQGKIQNNNSTSSSISETTVTGVPDHSDNSYVAITTTAISDSDKPTSRLSESNFQWTNQNNNSTSSSISDITGNGAPDHENGCVLTTVKTAAQLDGDKPACRLSDSNLQWTNQNLPTAAISPLSKQITPRSVSTGAIRKKPKLQSTCFWDSLSNTQACSHNSQESETAWENSDASSLHPVRESASDFPVNVVENIILDLQAALPFGQMREDSSLSFWSSINAYIINRIRAHMNVPLSHKSLASLRYSLDHILPLFSGNKFCDCESEFLKYISQFLYDCITCFMSTGRFTSNTSFATVPDGSSDLASVDKISETVIKMPIPVSSAIELRINMPPDDVFPPQFQTVLQQNNTLSDTETEDNANVDGAQPKYVMSEAEVGSDWGPDPEVETEVEAGTEADLAEADQSPGQGNISNDSSSAAESWFIEPDASVLRNVPASNIGCIVTEEDMNRNINDVSEVTFGALVSPDGCVDQETNLDDVPTKLCSAESEPQELEEEPSACLPSSDGCSKDDPELLSECNHCD